MRIALSCLALACAALAATSGTSVAQDTAAARYRVEVVLFAHNDFNPGEEAFDPSAQPTEPPEVDGVPRREYFDEMTRLALLRQIGNGIDTDSPPPEPFPGEFLSLETFEPERTSTGLDFRLLQPGELGMSALYDEIDRRPELRALAHGGWVQDGLDQSDAVAFDMGLLGTTNPRGTFTLYTGRFPHIIVDLSYQPPPETGPESAQGFFNPFEEPAARPAAPPRESELTDIDLPPRYTLRAEPRVPTDTTRHIDHPAFGVLVRVTLDEEEDDGLASRPPAP